MPAADAPIRRAPKRKRTPHRSATSRGPQGLPTQSRSTQRPARSAPRAPARPVSRPSLPATHRGPQGLAGPSKPVVTKTVRRARRQEGIRAGRGPQNIPGPQSGVVTKGTSEARAKTLKKRLSGERKRVLGYGKLLPSDRGRSPADIADELSNLKRTGVRKEGILGGVLGHHRVYYDKGTGKKIDSGSSRNPNTRVTRAAQQQYASAQAAAPVGKALAASTRPLHAIAGATDAALHGKNLGRAAKRGIQGKDHVNFGKVLRGVGVPKGIAAAGGLGLDVVFDPTTYLVGGLGHVAVAAAEKEGARVLAKAAEHGLTKEQAAKFGARAQKAKLASEHAAGRTNRGVQIKFAGKQVPGVQRGTAKVGRGITRATERVRPVRAVKHGLHEQTSLISPRTTPRGITEAEHTAIRAEARRARHSIGRASQESRLRARAIQKSVGKSNYQQMLDAIEHDDIKSLPLELQSKARYLADQYKGIRRQQRQAGIPVAERQNYVPHVRTKDFERDAEAPAMGVINRAKRKVQPKSSRQRHGPETLKKAREDGQPGVYSEDPGVQFAARMTEGRSSIAAAHLNQGLAKTGRPVAKGVPVEHQLGPGEAVYHQRGAELIEVKPKQHAHVDKNVNMEPRLKPAKDAPREPLSRPKAPHHVGQSGIDPEMLDRAAIHFGIHKPIELRPLTKSQVQRGVRGGLGRPDIARNAGKTVIYYNPTHGLGARNEAIWHELEHAREQQVLGRAHKPTDRMSAAEYKASENEAAANAAAEKYRDLDLTTPPTVSDIRALRGPRNDAVGDLPSRRDVIAGRQGPGRGHNAPGHATAAAARAIAAAEHFRQTGKMPDWATGAPAATKATKAAEAAPTRGGKLPTGRYVILHKAGVQRATASTQALANRTPAGAALDKTMGYWKLLATQINPGFHARNLVGDTSNHIFSRGMSRVPRNLYEGGRTVAAVSRNERRLGNSLAHETPVKPGRLTRRTGIDTPHYGHMTYDQIQDGLTKAGALRSGFQAGELRDLMQTQKTASKPFRTLMRWANNREDFARAATATDALRQGKTFEEAATAASNVHFDYSELSNFERNFLRRVLPFYTFTARNVPLQVRLLITHPGKFAAYQKVREEAAGLFGFGDGYEHDLPPWEQRTAGIPIKYKGHDFTISMGASGLPLTDLNEMPGPLGAHPVKQADEWMNRFMSMVTPVAKDPVELFANYSFFFRDQLQRDTGPLVAAPSIVGTLPRSLRKQLKIVPDYIDPATGKKTWGWPAKADYIAKLIPGTASFAVSVTKPKTSTGLDTPEKALSYLSGVRLAKVDPTTTRINDLYEENRKIEIAEAALRQRGVSAMSGSKVYQKLLDQHAANKAQIEGLRAKRGDPDAKAGGTGRLPSKPKDPLDRLDLGSGQIAPRATRSNPRASGSSDPLDRLDLNTGQVAPSQPRRKVKPKKQSGDPLDTVKLW